MSYEIKIQVRFNDFDCYGHVNNTNYLDFMEYARTSSFGSLVADGMKKGINYIVVSANISYKKPILYGEDVYVKVWVCSAKGAKFTLKYIIHDGKGKTFAEAESVHAAFNSKLGIPVRLDKDVISMMNSSDLTA